jgi:hypothetical protein
MRRFERRWALLAAPLSVLAIAAATLAAGVDVDADTDRSPSMVSSADTGCGAASAATLASVQTTVAKRIYRDELTGTETLLDASRVRAFAPLIEALRPASPDPAAVRAAVHALVYKPHWHIVRLRVTRGARVLADVGGPNVIAPVAGTLRSRGRTVGHYVLSVQDDLGYVKLVTRFIGAPVDLYRHGALVMGTLPAVASARSDGTRLDAGGRSYLVSNIAAEAFPSGALQVSLLAPSAPSTASCAALRIAAWGSVARHVEARLHPIAAHFSDLAGVLRAVTGGRVLVRAGGRRLVGGGPRHLPDSGRVSYAGRSWPVYSWQPVPGTRIYFLAPS